MINMAGQLLKTRLFGKLLELIRIIEHSFQFAVHGRSQGLNLADRTLANPARYFR